MLDAALPLRLICVARYNRLMDTVILSACGDHRIAALRLLFARFPEEEREVRLRDALAANERGTLSLDHLLLAEGDRQPVGSALVMIQADGIALVWPPVINDGTEAPSVIEDLLMREMCRRIDAGSVRLAQCLLAPDDDVESAVLTRHGFDRAADMYFLARPITRADLVPSTDRSNDCVAVESYQPENAERFAKLVEETYHGSLDCPYLNGIRTGQEAIASHKLSGQFNAERWVLYSVNGEDAGVLLLNDHPDQDAVELVYLGVAPHGRGRGLGRQMLRDGLSESARRGQAVMFLAVDCENCFANSLYGEFEFTELARRQVMLRRGTGLARQ